MKLYLVRHGDYISSEIDRTQPLSEKGIRESEIVAQFLQSKSLMIQEIQHSPKKRALQTAEIFRRILAPNIKLETRDYLRPTDSLNLLLNDINVSARNLMIVGHLPFFEKLASELLFADDRPFPFNFCNSCCLCLENEMNLWRVIWFVTPQLIGI